MNFFERSLIEVAHAVLAVWDYVKAAFAWLGSVLDFILQPVLSPLLGILNPICTFIADAVYKVLDVFPPWAGLIIISSLTGIVMLIAFRYLSNQAGISRAKDDIKANLLALKLFKDDLGVALRAQGRILWALARLQRYMLAPVLLMALPMMLLLAQMAMRYQWRPIMAGERFLLTVHSGFPQELERVITLEPGGGLVAEVGPIADGNDVSWRMLATQPGRQFIRIKVDSNQIDKEVVVGAGATRVGPYRPGKAWTDRLLYPIEPPLPSSLHTRIDGIEVVYPELRSVIYGAGYWILTFFVVSMVTAIAFAPIFRVRF